MTPIRNIARAYNSKVRSYAELLPWFGLASPGLVLNLDGSLLAVYEYSGSDVESSTATEADVACGAAEIAMRAFDDHNTMWTFLDKRRRRYLGQSEIANDVARYVDQVWSDTVDAGQLGSVRHVICVAYQPFGGGGGFFDEVAARAAAGSESFSRALLGVVGERLKRKTHIERLEGKLHAAIEAFEKQLTSFSTTLGSRVSMRRLKDARLLAELSNRANLASPRTLVQVPPGDLYYLNTLLPTDSVYREAGGMFRFEGSAATKYVTMHAVKGYPGMAHNETVEALLGLQADFTLAQMFRFLDSERAKKFIADQEGHYRANVKGVVVQAVEKLTGIESDRVNLGMLALADDAQEALIAATAGETSFGYHSMAVQVLADTPQDNGLAAERIYAVLTNAGYGLVRENVNAVGALSVTFPGAADNVLRQAFVSATNLADLTVLRTLSTGSERNLHLSEVRGTPSAALALLPTQTDVPEFFNLHVGDVGHFFIVGPAGSGKTTLINFLITLWQRYAPCRTIALDKDLSNYITITSLGGQYVDLRQGQPNAARMSPLRWARDPRDYPKLRRWLEIAMTAFDATALDVRAVQIIDRSIEMLAEQHGEKSLSALHAMLQGQSKELANRLVPWITGQRYGELFDHPDDDFALADICGVEMGGLLADSHLAPAVLAYLFEVIEESVDSTKPTFIYLEEAWYLLGNPTFRARFEDYIKTMRKRNALVGIATQSLADIRKSPISSTLNDNIKTRIFLPNMQAFDSIDVYRDMLGLRDEEVSVIRSAPQKRGYYIVQDGRRRLVDVALPPSILALTRSDVRAKGVFRQHLQSGASDWLANYIQEITHG